MIGSIHVYKKAAPSVYYILIMINIGVIRFELSKKKLIKI